MGRLSAADMIEHTTTEQALAWHLTANHYPPVPTSMVAVCLEAIEITNKANWGDAAYSDPIELPDGVTWRGNNYAPASAIIEAHHLDAFLDQEEEE
jgi:hypothetical protein